jgi:hypothetical protein
MDEGKSTTPRRPGFADTYVRGLRSAARNNASAYGYSVTITATFGILSVVTAVTTVLEIFTFAGGRGWLTPSSRAWPRAASGTDPATRNQAKSPLLGPP